MVECRSGLTTLMSTQVVHCDIKPSNILLSKDWKEAKIGDVGLGRYMLGSHLSTASGVRGAVGYVAPEVHLSVKEHGVSGAKKHFCNEKVRWCMCECVRRFPQSSRRESESDVNAARHIQPGGGPVANGDRAETRHDAGPI